MISGSSICAGVSRSLPSFMAFMGLISLFFGWVYFGFCFLYCVKVFFVGRGVFGFTSRMPRGFGFGSGVMISPMPCMRSMVVLWLVSSAGTSAPMVSAIGLGFFRLGVLVGAWLGVWRRRLRSRRLVRRLLGCFFQSNGERGLVIGGGAEGVSCLWMLVVFWLRSCAMLPFMVIESCDAGLGLGGRLGWRK